MSLTLSVIPFQAKVTDLRGSVVTDVLVPSLQHSLLCAPLEVQWFDCIRFKALMFSFKARTRPQANTYQASLRMQGNPTSFFHGTQVVE